jgi:hypothetical protein
MKPRSVRSDLGGVLSDLPEIATAQPDEFDLPPEGKLRTVHASMEGG